MAGSSPALTVKGLIGTEIVMPGLDRHPRARANVWVFWYYTRPLIPTVRAAGWMPGTSPGTTANILMLLDFVRHVGVSLRA